MKNTLVGTECLCIPFLLLLAESMTVVTCIFSSHFFCWWPWMLLLPLSCFNQCAFLREDSSHSALHLNIILVKAGLYFFCWAYGSICWIIEFLGYFLNLENNLVIWPANKSKFLKEELLLTYCFQTAEVTLK